MRSPRTLAAIALASVITHRASLSEALAAHLGGLSGRDRAMAGEMAFGVCRRYHELDAILRQLLQKPLRTKDADIHALLLLGLYQLRYMRVPDHAAVAESVAAAYQLNKRWASGLVNAVLRGFLTRAAQLYLALNEAQKLSHPDWLLQRIRQAWPEHHSQIIAANNAAPEMALRVNRRRVSRDDWMQLAQEAHIDACAGDVSTDAVMLQRGLDVERLPGFGAGLVSVQDQAAQLAAPLLRCEPNQRVLDACAAPGGKTCHLLEMHALQLISLDTNENRLRLVAENLQRLGLQSTLLRGDAAEPATWWDGKPFDRILLDAPCSATGVIRRHPDIKLLRDPRQVAVACARQSALLAGVWKCLAERGLLLYCTCSILPEENESVVRSFLENEPHARVERMDVAWGIAREFGRQLLPASGHHDGFYYALLRKEPPT